MPVRVSGMTGERIRYVREKLGLTQREMAEAVGLHVNSYAKAERGEMAISRTLAKVVLWIAATGEPHPPFAELGPRGAKGKATRKR